MDLKASYPIIMLCLMVIFIGCKRGHIYSDENDSYVWERQCSEFINAGDFHKVDSIAMVMKSVGEHNNDPLLTAKSQLYGGIYQQGLSDTENDKREQMVKQAHQYALNTKNDSLLSCTYNIIGCWETGRHKNLHQAIIYFTEAMQAADRAGIKDLGIGPESNLSEVYRLLGDTLSYTHDKHLYRYSIEKSNDALRFASALHCAMYLASHSSDFEELKPYLEYLRSIGTSYHELVPAITAEFWLTNRHINNAIAELPLLKGNETMYSDEVRAMLLNKAGQYEESLALTEDLLKEYQANEVGIAVDGWLKLMELKADNLASLGHHVKAYEEHKKYAEARDSVDSFRAREMVNRYKVLYEVADKDKRIMEHQAVIRRVSTGINVVILIVIVAGVFIWLYIRRRNTLYRNIVKLNSEFIKREETLVAQVAGLEEELAATKDTGSPNGITDSNRASVASASSLSSDRESEIFLAIRKKAEHEQIWRDPTITREKFADMVGCNRTYFTEVIRNCTGMNYSQYMNSLRVREAIVILSDSSNETPIKDLAKELGFLSPSTFFAVFKQTVGLSPNAYRATSQKQIADNNRKEKPCE